jgi:hypothetical protein
MNICERCDYDDATREPRVEFSDRYLAVCDHCYVELCKIFARLDGSYKSDD